MNRRPTDYDFVGYFNFISLYQWYQAGLCQVLCGLEQSFEPAVVEIIRITIGPKKVSGVIDFCFSRNSGPLRDVPKTSFMTQGGPELFAMRTTPSYSQPECEDIVCVSKGPIGALSTLGPLQLARGHDLDGPFRPADQAKATRWPSGHSSDYCPPVERGRF